ncbi:conjugal transfer protein TrbJ [Pseudomonas syringae]|uniref:conjugal transfer protein TrbJ n=1 Tax=Pseudomonas syringae TaxID=317 RepID=UPI0001CC25DE|nr:hypothetical protein C5I_0121160 [Pseudomonas syringae pv. syringae FF5]MBP1120133.1 hypothetical protein [Pseudomonas sp. PvP028]MBS7438505.1 hypothetical protein [Pseudomonas syringae]QWB05818.1 hypothetical protein KLC09_19530 [Pseudomonas syringae]
MKKQQWIFAVASALPFHLAFAGIPVVDGLNLSQPTVSAIQNVAAVTKQIEQYKTQSQQYQIMLRISAAPADYIWSQADQTISKHHIGVFKVKQLRMSQNCSYTHENSHRLDFFDFGIGWQHGVRASEINQKHSIGDQLGALHVGFMERVPQYNSPPPTKIPAWRPAASNLYGLCSYLPKSALRRI